MTTVYIVRHAEAVGNSEFRFNGITDTDITEKGEHQLDSLAERFRSVSFDRIYSSPLIRTRKTADAVNRFHGLDIIIDNDIIEINGGSWEGRKMDEVGKESPELVMMWVKDPLNFKAPDGESMRDVFARVSSALKRLAAENQGKTIVVVSHGCAIKNMLCYASTGDMSEIGKPDIAENTAVSKVIFDDALNASVEFSNDSSHLSEELKTFRRAMKEHTHMEEISQ